MDVLDWAVLAAAALAAARGARRGAAAQLLSFAGFLAGLAAGVGLVLLVDPRLHGVRTKTIVALVLLLAPALLLSAVGHRLGQRAWSRLRRLHVGWLDAAGGAVLAAAGTLVVCWLFASVLVDTSVATISQQIQSSRIIRAVSGLMPPVPDAFSAVQRYLASSGFPQVFVNALPEPTGPVRLPSASQVGAVAQRVDGSTVKVLALGCGDLEQEGSGFAVSSDLVVTNAHVIAGTNQIRVVLPDGERLVAKPVLFDPVFDLAVLRTSPLGMPVLRVDPSYVERGTEAVVFGYPNGGPLRVVPAGIERRFIAEGRDIYDSGLSTRAVYALRSVVRPGNSGGPLVDLGGEVIGVVFSRSASNPDLGYALASPAVLQRIDTVNTSGLAVSTQSCIAGS